MPMNKNWKNFKSELRPFVMLVSLVIIWWGFNRFTDGAFLEARNLSNLFRQMAITGILASGMVLVIVMGQIDLSIGSLSAFLGGVLAVMDQGGSSPAVSLGCAILAGLFLGGLQGVLTSYVRIPSFIVTLGGMMSLRGFTMWITSNSTIPLNSESLLAWGNNNVSNSMTAVVLALALVIYLVASTSAWAKGRKHHPDLFSVSAFMLPTFIGVSVFSFAGWIFYSYEGLPYPVLLMAVVAIAIQLFATRTIWGRHIYAIGGNKEAAFLSGVPVRKRLVFVFVLTGLLSAIAGLVLTARVGSASPDAGQLLELDAIAACVIGGTSLIGGRGSIYGALLGALIIESLNNGMSLANMEPYWQFIIKGLVLVIAVGIDMASREKKGLLD